MWLIIITANKKLHVIRVEPPGVKYVRHQVGSGLDVYSPFFIQPVKLELGLYVPFQGLGIPHEARYGHGYVLIQGKYLVRVLARHEIAHGGLPLCPKDHRAIADKPHSGSPCL